MIRKTAFVLATVVLAGGLSACQTTSGSHSGSTAADVDLKAALEQKQRENAALQATLKEMETRMGMEKGSTDAAVQAKMAPMEAPLLPPKALPGECYARVFVPPETKMVTKTLLKKEAAEKVETLPAQYGWKEETVLVKEASERYEVVPATYRWVEERVMVKEASKRLVDVPATYRTVSEKILVRPAYSAWKKGRGPIEKVDNITGEIMCLVEYPAEYKTIEKRVIDQAASVRTIEIPAEYKNVRKQVIDQPARTVKVEIPAEYKNVKVRTLVKDAQEMRTPIPAEYQEVTEEVQVSSGHLEWRPILCETNTTVDVVRKLQNALKNAGYDPVMIDGVVGHYTMKAVKAYQKDKGLAEGQLTIETLKHLRVI